MIQFLKYNQSVKISNNKTGCGIRNFGYSDYSAETHF